VDRIYSLGDKVRGSLVVQSDGFAHSGVSLTLNGTVALQLSAKSVGLFEAFYNSLKPVTLMDYKLNIEQSGNIAKGTCTIPFEFDLKPLEGQELHETYHGVYVNITYMLKADIIRKWVGKDLTKSIEFIVERLPDKIPDPVKEIFDISPESIDKSTKKGLVLPNFRITGHIDTLTMSIETPLSGVLKLELCEEPIKCIELQLVRVETCGCADGFAKEATEIQNIQIVDGDVQRGVEVPIFMIFPRLFTCPSLVSARTFKVEFQVNLVLMFPDGRLVSKKFPLTLLR